ncbi:MAG TPA: hypothetical protein VI454_00780 [Verrucomicrobiae bacterium]
MNTNEELKLQAYADGELSPREAAKVAALIERDGEARALFTELKRTKDLLAANEPEILLPESREFHWSKIAREIERHESRPAMVRRFASPAWWLKYFSPVAATALIAAMVIIYPNITDNESDAQTAPAPETSSVVFRSQSEGMTVVWLQGDENYEFANPESDL